MRYIFEALISIGKNENDKENQGWMSFDEVLPDGVAPGVWLMKKVLDENKEKLDISDKEPNLKFIQSVRIKLSTPEILHVWEEIGKAQGVLLRCQVCGAEGERFLGSNRVKMAKWCTSHPFCNGMKVYPPPSTRPAEPLEFKEESGIDGSKLSTVFTIPEIKGEEVDTTIIDLLNGDNQVIKRKVQKSAFIINNAGVDIHRLMPKEFELLLPRLRPLEQKSKAFVIYELIKD